VGIGTASPGVRLEVSGASAASSFNALRMANTDTTASSPVTTLFQSADDGTLRNRATMTSGSDGSNNGYIALSTRSSGSITEKFRLNSTGALVLAGGSTTANGVGITFPATQSASSDANTLDDYEEGTWTPTLLSTGATFSYPRGQYGSYCKIGGLVYAQFYIGADASGTTSNSCQIASLPFASQNLGSLAQSSAFAWISRPTLLGFTVGNNASTIDLWLQNGGLVFATASQTAGGYIVGSVIYRAA
jgi:hypothetical protein